MKKIGIFYGSTTGTTEKIAHDLAHLLDVDDKDVHDVASSAPSDIADYDVLLLGSSTWGAGDLQDDWYDFLDGLSALDLSDKEVALFGCGDETMSDTFCGAVAKIHHALKDTGAKFIGAYNTIGYDFEHSDAVGPDGAAVGLLIDDVNHSDLTKSRLTNWVRELKAEI